MANPTLNILLKDYEQKKYIADLKHEKEKSEFYDSHPELSSLNSELGKLALNISKAILEGNIDLSNRLKTDFEKLKIEKEKMLSSVDIPERC